MCENVGLKFQNKECENHRWPEIESAFTWERVYMRTTSDFGKEFVFY